MPIKVTCPKCQGVLHAPDDAGGKRGKCPTCGTVLAIPAAGLAGPSPSGSGLSSSVPVGGGKPLAEAPGYGLMPPSAPAADVRQSSVPMLPRPGEPARPAAGFGAPPPVKPAPAGGFSRPSPLPADAAAEEVLGYRRARRGLGLVQTGQFFMLLGGLAGPGVAIGRLYGLHLPDKDPGFLGKPGLNATKEIEYAAVLVPLALGLLFALLGRIGFGNLPRSSYARGPAKLGGLFKLLAVAGLVAFMAMSVSARLSGGLHPVQWADNGYPSLSLLPGNEINGQIQTGGLLAFLVFGLLAEACFVGAIGRVAANLRHPRAASRHTRFLVYAHLGAGLVLGWFLLRALWLNTPTGSWPDVWDWTAAHWDDLLGKAGPARPAVVYGLMAVPVLVAWWLYARLVGGGRRAIGDWLAAHA